VQTGIRPIRIWPSSGKLVAARASDFLISEIVYQLSGWIGQPTVSTEGDAVAPWISRAHAEHIEWLGELQGVAWAANEMWLTPGDAAQIPPRRIAYVSGRPLDGDLFGSMVAGS